MDYANVAPMMGQLWSPIAAVTSSWRGRDNAQIAVAIAGASIVPEKPRVVVQLYKTNLSHDMVYASGAFCLNFLRDDQLQPIRDFGFRSGRDADKLSGYAYDAGSTGSPVLQDCWGYLDCVVVNAMDGGDMTCFLADVVDGDTLTDGEPLLWRDARRTMPAEWSNEWDRKIQKEIAHSSERMTRIDHKPWTPQSSTAAVPAKSLPRTRYGAGIHPRPGAPQSSTSVVPAKSLPRTRYGAGIHPRPGAPQ